MAFSQIDKIIDIFASKKVDPIIPGRDYKKVMFGRDYVVEDQFNFFLADKNFYRWFAVAFIAADCLQLRQNRAESRFLLAQTGYKFFWAFSDPIIVAPLH